MNTDIKTVAEYLANVPPKERATLQKLRKTIRATARGAEEKIGYGMPGFKYSGRMLVYFAAFKGHCSFFAGRKLLATFKKELKPFDTSVGTIRFTADHPLPPALVKKIVKLRMRENEALAKAKKKTY